MQNNKTFSEICINCQICCKSVGVYAAHPYTKEVKEFYKARGVKVTKRNIQGETLIFLEFDIPCPNLDSKKGCLIYKNRPKVCKSFPSEESSLLDNCQLHIQGLL